MPDKVLQASDISRLSLKSDRYDTVLLDGRPLAEVLSGETGDEDMAQLVFPVDLYDRDDQRVVLERLAGLHGWTPVLVCPDDMDLSCTVVSAWVEERDGLIIWRRFAFGPDGEAGPVEAGPLAFDKEEYSRFISRAAELVRIEHLIVRLISKPPREACPDGELKRLGAGAAFDLLSRMIYDSARSRRFWKGGRLTVLRNTLKTILISVLICVLIVSVIHIFADVWSVEAVIGMTLGALLLVGLIEAADLSLNRELWPPVFMTAEGFLVGWKLELISWDALGGCPSRPPEDAPPQTPDRLVVEADGRVHFQLNYVDGSGKVDPALSVLSAQLFDLISGKL